MTGGGHVNMRGGGQLCHHEGNHVGGEGHSPTLHVLHQSSIILVVYYYHNEHSYNKYTDSIVTILIIPEGQSDGSGRAGVKMATPRMNTKHFIVHDPHLIRIYGMLHIITTTLL